MVVVVVGVASGPVTVSVGKGVLVARVARSMRPRTLVDGEPSSLFGEFNGRVGGERNECCGSTRGEGETTFALSSELMVEPIIGVLFGVTGRRTLNCGCELVNASVVVPLCESTWLVTVVLVGGTTNTEGRSMGVLFGVR